MVKVGVMICDRNRTCTGNRCFKSIIERDGAFAKYSKARARVSGKCTVLGEASPINDATRLEAYSPKQPTITPDISERNHMKIITKGERP